MRIRPKRCRSSDHLNPPFEVQAFITKCGITHLKHSCVSRSFVNQLLGELQSPSRLLRLLASDLDTPLPTEDALAPTTKPGGLDLSSPTCGCYCAHVPRQSILPRSFGWPVV